MRKLYAAALLLALGVPALSLHADVTPSDVKNVAEEKRETIEKNTRQAGNKLTTEQGGDKKKAPKKKHSFFDANELHKDRSLPPGDKVQMTDDKPRKRPSLSEQLHKDRSDDK